MVAAMAMMDGMNWAIEGGRKAGRHPLSPVESPSMGGMKNACDGHCPDGTRRHSRPVRPVSTGIRFLGTAPHGGSLAAPGATGSG